MKIRRAVPEDLSHILRWRSEAAAWLETLGSDQWSDAGLTRRDFYQRVSKSITAGNTWIAEDDDGTPLGTIAIDTIADPGLWDDDEIRDAYVIHRMIIDRAAAGRGVGTAMLDHAEHLAAQDGRQKLVLDAWTSNPDLHAYYESQGFDHVRTVASHRTPSAALFVRAVRG